MPDLDTEITVEFDIKCDECGRDLSDGVNVQPPKYPRDVLIEVAPCPDCTETAKQNGREEAEEEMNNG